ncbi:MAG: choice-of-anchor J domain-containing protein, partial [Prevotellaceae bacterium]|nr:choice-of-anchor J domain-containing protein [Prevotellaceae bacterium]
KDSTGLSLKILENTTAARSATVTLTSLDKTASATFTIQQSGKVTLYNTSFSTGAERNEWTLIDKDGDGQKWTFGNFGGTLGIAVFSESYGILTGTEDTYTPENYLVSPAISVPANATSITISWYAMAYYAPPYDQEKHKLIISETPITPDNCSGISPAKVFAAPANDIESVDLTGYAGKTIYIAIAHYDCTNMGAIIIDDFSVVANL